MFRSKQLLAGFIVFTFILLGWNPIPAITADDKPHEGGTHEIEFDYRPNDPRGPEQWGNLEPEWSLCKDGKSQSPIEIWEKDAVKETKTDKDLVVDYQPANATIKNEEHAIAVVWEGDAGKIDINGTEYLLKQCHWHHPAEHVVDGIRYDLELHMVHKTQDNQKIAVIGFLYKLGAPNSFLTTAEEHMTTLADIKHGIPLGVLDPRKVMKKVDKKGQFYRYIGSLTTPPCVEDVIFNINKKVQTVAPEQVKRLEDTVFDYASNNARPIQPLNGREYKLYGDCH